MGHQVNPKVRKTKKPPAKTIIQGQETLKTGFMEDVAQEDLDADARLWTEKFNATTPEQLARLEKLFDEDIAKGTFPLDLSGK